MFRITIKETASQQSWVLHGRLTKGAAAELIATWQKSRNHLPAKPRIVDLDEVTSIDRCGEDVLSTMISDGAKFIATGVYTKHLLEELRTKKQFHSLPIDPVL